MFELSKEQVDFILNDIRRNGIEMEELQLNLLDHICCLVEEEMSPELNFEVVYQKVLPRFFEKELREIQEETELLLTFKNYYKMKRIMLNTGIISAFVFTFGVIFKIMHWPGASVMLILPIAAISFIFLPLLFLFKSKETKEVMQKVMIGSGVIFGIIISLATTFKVMHWPGANMLWLFSLGILFFLFLPLFFFAGIRNPETKTNTIISSVLILMAGGLLFTLTDLSNTRQRTEELNAKFDNHLMALSEIVHGQNEQPESMIRDSSQNSNYTRVHEQSDAICEKINALKDGLMKAIPGQPEKFTEEEFVKIYGNDRVRTSAFFFDDEKNPHANLVALKNDLQELYSNVNQSSKEGSQILSFFANEIESVDTPSDKSSWEEINFRDAPAQLVLRYLNQLLLDVRIFESKFL